jgi:hypothetical protein
VTDFHLRKTTEEKREKSSMTFKKYREPSYDSFRNGPQTSMCINSNPSFDLDSTAFLNLWFNCDRIHRLQVKIDSQSIIKYPSS